MKKWLSETIKEVAERTNTGWRIKAEAPASPAPKPEAGPPVDAKQSQQAATPTVKPGSMLKFLNKART